MTDPLIVDVEVAAPPDHAFEVWTRRCATWWPPTHTVSGDPASIVFDPRPGGAITEHAPDGTTHHWGTVLDWEPPTHLRYRWHLFFDPADATEVDITFTPDPDDRARTHVRLEHRGWERLGPAGPPRRERTHGVWRTLVPLYRTAAAVPRPSSDPPRDSR